MYTLNSNLLFCDVREFLLGGHPGIPNFRLRDMGGDPPPKTNDGWITQKGGLDVDR